MTRNGKWLAERELGEEFGRSLVRALAQPRPPDVTAGVQSAVSLLNKDEDDGWATLAAIRQAVTDFARGVDAAASEHDDPQAVARNAIRIVLVEALVVYHLGPDDLGPDALVETLDPP